MYKKPKRIKKRGSFLKNRFFLFGVATAVCIGLLFYGIVLFPFFQIQEVRTEGNEEVLGNTIKNVVLSRLWGEFLFFPTASFLLVDTQAIEDALLEAVPELETVSIQREFPNMLIVTVRERAVAALWCQPPHLNISGGGQHSCFSLDKEGVAFQEVPASLDFPVITSFREAPENFREAVVEKDALFAVLDFSREMKHRSVLGDEASVQFHIVSENQIEASMSEGWSIYFTQSQDLSWQAVKLQTVLENKIPLAKRARLEYIDVRFGDQAYFKYR